MKKLFTLLALTISFSMNGQMSDNSGSTSATGSASIAMGFATTASGNYSTAMGFFTEASGDYSTAMGQKTTASDYSSTVIGQYNSSGSSVTDNATSFSTSNTAFVIGNGTANDSRSDALTVLFDGTTTIAGAVTATAFIGDGSQLTNLPVSPFRLNDTSGNGIQSNNNTASGDISTAMGASTTASGIASTAMGYNTIASGDVSTAMGYYTTASDRGSLVIGEYNLLGTTVTNSASQFSTENTAFVIGNGTANDSRSDALTVLFDGTTTIAGAVTATAFIGDGSQLTNLPVSPFRLNDTSGNGIQSETNTASGNYSIAMGIQTTASGNYSTAMGVSTTASGGMSTAMGYYTTASGDYSTAMGDRTVASGEYSTAMGASTIANGNYSTAMGYGAIAEGNSSTAMGWGTTASGDISTAMGASTTASGGISTAMGASTAASGDVSTAMGYNTTASDRGSLVIGEYNLLGSTVTNSASQFSTENTAFVIGNGTANDSRSDALTVLFDGTTTIAGDLSINSDARLKANIISLGSTLAKLLQIDGKTYTMKKDKNKKQKIGVLAQDIEKVFPELVSESNGVKSVNYQGLVPVLINALKEQDNKMNAQEAKLNKQQAEIDELKAIVTKLITP